MSVVTAARHPRRYPRTELLNELTAVDGLAVVDAPLGFGKTTLAADLATVTGGIVVGLDGHGHDPAFDLDAHWEEAGQPEVYIVDDVSPHLADQLSQWRSPTRLVVGIGASIFHGSAFDKAVRFGPDDLLVPLDALESAAADLAGPVAPRILAHVILSQSGGWPAHAYLALNVAERAGESGPGLVELLRSHPRLDALAESVLDSIDARTIAGLGQLATFERFPMEAALALLTRLRFGQLQEQGFPFLPRDDGWLSVVPLLRERLIGRPGSGAGSGLTADNARLLAPMLVARGGPFTAAKLLHGAGSTGAAIELLCSVPEPYLDAVDQMEANAFFRALRARAGSDPKLALRHARVCRNLAQLQSQAQAIDAAVELARRSGDAHTAQTARAEQLLLSVGRTDPGDLDRQLDELEAQNRLIAWPDGDRWAVDLRCREIRAAGLAQSSRLLDITGAAQELNGIALEWEQHDDRARAAAALRQLAAGPLSHLGRYGEAIVHLERARHLAQDQLFLRALASELLTRFNALAGDQVGFEQALAEATAFTGTLNLSWLTGYVHWAAMLGAPLGEGLSGAIRHHLAAAANLGELHDHDTGVVFWSESASTFAVLGDGDRAFGFLAKAADRRQQNELEVALAELIVEGRVGDPQAALGLGRALLDDDQLPDGRRWRVELEMSRATAGSGSVPTTWEPPRAELGPTGSCSHLVGPLPAEPDRETPEVEVRLFGEFAVFVSDTEVVIPAGKAAALLKMLSLQETALPIDRVIDWLWPEVEPELGRQRLKNVVSRLRSTAGEHVVVRSGDTISIGSGVRSDLHLFRQAARRAAQMIRTEPALAIANAIDALSVYVGDVLPSDAYAEWAWEERDVIRAQATSLFELVLDHTGDHLAPPVWLLDTAVRLGITSDLTYLRIAQTSRASGSTETARAAIARARSIAAGLGVPLDQSIELDDLLP